MKTLSLLAALAVAAPATAQTIDPDEVQTLYRVRCATPERDPSVYELFPASDCAYSSTNPSAAYDPGVTYDIPVVVHVIQNTSGQGFISAAQVQSQIDILNEDFLALAGTPGAPGVDCEIQFHLANVDPGGNPTNGITYSTNNNWYNDSGSYWNSLAWDTNRYLNIYTNQASGALGYVPDIPQGGIVGTNQDRVVVLWDSFGRNAPIGPPYNQGRTTTHEVGHYLGLYHTFSGGCAGAAGCNSNGDLICDTNPQGNPTFGCPGSSSSCGSSNPFHNYMDYSDDTCMWEFTTQQMRRMRCTLEFWRPNLGGNGGGGNDPMATSVNIDIGTAAGVPGSGYGGAAGQAGFWNGVVPPSGGTLLDLSGAATSTTISGTGGAEFNQDNAGTGGGDDDLLDDLQDVGGVGSSSTWTVNNIENGDYDVYVYAWAPDDRTAFSTDITVVGGSNGTQLCGATAWPGSHVLGGTYVVDTVSVTNNTIQITAATNSGFGSVNGIQVVESGGAPCGTSVNYGTGGATTNGCQATMTGSGTPSGSAGSGFTLSCTNMEGAKQGLIFYGINGRRNTPWGSSTSTLLVQTPTQRTPAGTSSGAAGTCNGVLAIDWNAYVQTPGKLGVPFSGGETVNAQCWFRDPPSVETTHLSDGIEFIVCP